MAQISHRDQMVVFGDCQSTMDRHRQCQLEEQLSECMRLQERLGKANEQLALDPRYVQKVSSTSVLVASVHVCIYRAHLVVCQRTIHSQRTISCDDIIIIITTTTIININVVLYVLRRYNLLYIK